MSAPPPSVTSARVVTAGEWRYPSGEHGASASAYACIPQLPIGRRVWSECPGASAQPASIRLVPARSGASAPQPMAGGLQQRDMDSPTKAEFADKAKFFFGAVQDMQKSGNYRPRSKPRGSLFANGPVEMDDIWEPSAESPRGG